MIVLPFPPSANRLWRAVGGRNIKSAEYREWITTAGWELNRQRPVRITGQVSVYMLVCPPDKRRRDIDNSAKACLDLLVAHKVVERDDNQIVRRLTIDAGDVKDGGSVVVRVEATR